jgi:hypothetical protein
MSIFKEKGPVEVMGSESDLKGDVLHPESHKQLSAEEIAKALARHSREHPSGKMVNPPMKQQKKAAGKH